MLETAQRSMTRDEAETLTSRIKIALDGTWELIRDAYMGRVWVPLGYETWDDYTVSEFGATRLRLPKEERQQAVASLRDCGLSVRAIASGLGVSKNTVTADLSQTGTPEPVEKMRPDEVAALVRGGFVESIDELVEVSGLNVNTRTGEVIEDAPVVTEHTVTEKVKTTIGLDGKEYKRPEPRPVPTGDDATKLNAIQASKSIGRSLEALQYLNYENARNGIVTEWWPLGKHEVPPEQANYFTPAELRKLAQGLNTTADLLEAHHVN